MSSDDQFNVSLVEDKDINIAETHYYKILFFTNITIDNKIVSAEDTSILYKLDLEQVN